MSVVIDTSALVKSFATTCAIDGIDLAIRVGSVYGLLGPNGAERRPPYTFSQQER